MVEVLRDLFTTYKTGDLLFLFLMIVGSFEVTRRCARGLTRAVVGDGERARQIGLSPYFFILLPIAMLPEIILTGLIIYKAYFLIPDGMGVTSEGGLYAPFGVFEHELLVGALIGAAPPALGLILGIAALSKPIGRKIKPEGLRFVTLTAAAAGLSSIAVAIVIAVMDGAFSLQVAVTFLAIFFLFGIVFLLIDTRRTIADCETGDNEPDPATGNGQDGTSVGEPGKADPDRVFWPKYASYVVFTFGPDALEYWLRKLDLWPPKPAPQPAPPPAPGQTVCPACAKAIAGPAPVVHGTFHQCPHCGTQVSLAVGPGATHRAPAVVINNTNQQSQVQKPSQKLPERDWLGLDPTLAGPSALKTRARFNTDIHDFLEAATAAVHGQAGLLGGRLGQTGSPASSKAGGRTGETQAKPSPRPSVWWTLFCTLGLLTAVTILALAALVITYGQDVGLSLVALVLVPVLFTASKLGVGRQLVALRLLVLTVSILMAVPVVAIFLLLPIALFADPSGKIFDFLTPDDLALIESVADLAPDLVAISVAILATLFLTAIAYAFAATERRLTKAEGIILIGLYFVYVTVMLWFWSFVPDNPFII